MRFVNPGDLRAAPIACAPCHRREVQRVSTSLMTTGAMVLGALPLAIASGAGAESRQQIGWVIVGGMSFGTLLTLFVVPTVYSFLGQVHRAGGATEAAVATPAPAE